MPAHMAKKQRHGRGAFLLIALGVGLAVFVLVDPDARTDLEVDTTSGRPVPSSASPSVLGAVVTRASDAPLADPAAPATFAPDTATTPRRATTSRRAVTTTTTPPPTIGTPWSIDNTTTTDGSATSSTTDTSTTSSSTSEPPPTTADTTTTSQP